MDKIPIDQKSFNEKLNTGTYKNVTGVNTNELAKDPRVTYYMYEYGDMFALVTPLDGEPFTFKFTLDHSKLS